MVLKLIKLCVVANFRSPIPLCYYSILADTLNAREDAGLSGEYRAAPTSSFNQDIANPNTFNRGSAFPVIMRSSLPQDDQVGGDHSTILSRLCCRER